MLHITESELARIISDAVNKARDLSSARTRNLVIELGNVMERRNRNTLCHESVDGGCGSGPQRGSGCGPSESSYSGCGQPVTYYGGCGVTPSVGC